MSYTHSAGVANARGRVEYIVYGKGEMRREHLANGTDRMASMVCTMGDLDAFIERAESMTSKGRKLQAYSYIQSFKNTEFDPTNRYDVQAVNDLGLELALRLNPDAEHLVVTHVDGKGPGGCGAHPHNHIVTVNDDGHGRSLQRGKLHSHVRATNDALMRENGLDTIGVTHSRERTTEDQATYWADVRGRLTSFDTRLGDRVAAAVEASTGGGVETFTRQLQARGVQLVTTESDGIPSWTYKMRDPESKNRLRRRKAEKLSDDLDAPSVLQRLKPLSGPTRSLAPEPAPVSLWQDRAAVAAARPNPPMEVEASSPLGDPIAAAARRARRKARIAKELEKAPPARRRFVVNKQRERGYGS